MVQQNARGYLIKTEKIGLLDTKRKQQIPEAVNVQTVRK
jgi:hypothetical protein